MSQISNLGTITSLVGDDAGVWTGTISASSDDLAALPPLDEFFTEAVSAAPTRCIDGRPLVGSMDDPALQGRPLGPQLAGGTPVIAALRRIVLGTDSAGDVSLDADLAATISELAHGGLGFGGHIDDHHAATDEDTGCGAVDKLHVILARIADPAAWQQITFLAAQLLGANYDAERAEALHARVVAFQAQADAYFGRDGEHYPYKQRAAAAMREQAAGEEVVEELSGGHLEKALLINTVDGTTFSRDRFDAAYAGGQVFGYDVWYVQWVAASLFPGDDQAAVDARTDFTLLHVFYSIATAMVLTDGSQALLVRQ